VVKQVEYHSGISFTSLHTVWMRRYGNNAGVRLVNSLNRRLEGRDCEWDVVGQDHRGREMYVQVLGKVAV
jgi:hypothetical protein